MIDLVAVVTSLNSGAHHPVAAGCHHAAGSALIGVHLVAVVTALDTLLDHPIAASGDSAAAQARVRVHEVSIIASFHTRSNHPIATGSFHAGVEATVVVVLVAVVADLKPLSAGFEVTTHDPVAASGEPAPAGAGVDLDGVAVIAGLASVQPAVSAHLSSALGVAAITWLYVAIVAAFHAELQNRVTAARLTALPCTGVRVDSVAVVASFALIEPAVTAALCEAGAGAAVAVLRVAVIALLKALILWRNVTPADAITAAGDLTA